MGNKHSKSSLRSFSKDNSLVSITEKFREAYPGNHGHPAPAPSPQPPPPPYRDTTTDDDNKATTPAHECPQYEVTYADDVRLHTSDNKYLTMSGNDLLFASYDFVDKLTYIAGQKPIVDLSFHDERYETYDILLRFKILLEGGPLTPPNGSGDSERECKVIEDLILKLNMWKASPVLNNLKFQIISWIYAGQVSFKQAISLASRMDDPKLSESVLRLRIKGILKKRSAISPVEGWRDYMHTRWMEAFEGALEETSNMGDAELRWKACADAFEKALA
ncbi:hypothetical protein I302_102811 [Kwoniella bestiolae CBS 10118]|uniref:BTB domain-containing protein n=1 Tax=Kwoniella bestiolae CBS 10118 TaxID=1296100 RepID=A0A1B9GG31_9TREE|nr:hypothetical protein I302_01506 [Kwoniella bestiolae CBS 10118]OCF29989.1 hypothetical protein I302_01506 [Kwoniella bestiolae CBS 10118]